MELTVGTWQIAVRRVPPTAAEIVAMYDAVADSWDRTLAVLGYPRAYADLFARLRAAAALGPLRPGLCVLDCGIGTAALTLALATLDIPDLRVVGVDLTPAMLHRARWRLRGRRVRAHLGRADAQRLPFADGTFDLVISAHMLEHSPDPGLAVRELARVLRPGAPLVVVTTRRGLPDALLRWRWRYATLAPDRLACWLAAASVDHLCRYALAPTLLPARMSVAYAGRKRIILPSMEHSRLPSPLLHAPLLG